MTVKPAGSFGQLPEGGGGAIVTVSVAIPLFPSLVAVIVVVPASNADTKPPADTVATFSAVDVHVTVRPVKTAPLASRSVAVNCCVPPTVTLADVGLTVTDPTVFRAPAAVARLTL